MCKNFSMCIFILKFSLFLGLIITCATTLSAGPMYAARYKLGDQAVYLYSDIHNTHEFFGEKEKEITKHFLHTLGKQENILLLIEDTFGLEYKEIYEKAASKNDPGFLGHLINQTLRNNEQTNLPSVCTKSVDLRGDIALCRFMLKDHILIQKALEKELSFTIKPFVQEINEKIGSITLNQFALKPSMHLVEMLKSTTDEALIKILSRIHKEIYQRYEDFWVAFEKLGIDDFKTLTLSELCEKTAITSKYNEKYLHYLTLLHFVVSRLVDEYCNGIVEARTLVDIVQAKDTHKKVVVVLGDAHIARLEGYLDELGYKRIAQEGIETRIAFRQPFEHFYDLLRKDVEKDTTFIGNARDQFYLSLHYIGRSYPEAAMQYLTQVAETVQIPPPLISLEAIDWINQ